MKKNFIMLFALAVVMSAAVACFTPSSKADPKAPTSQPTGTR